MSNHLISEVYRRQVGNIARKAVMGLLADKASDDGSGIWASKQRMADEIGASKQTVIVTMKGLAADGLIEERGQRRCTNGYTIEYAINVKALKALPLVKCHAEYQSEDLTGQAPLPVKQLNPTGQIPLPDQSEDLTQTLQNPPEPPKEGSAPDDAPLTPDEVLEGWNHLADSTGLPRIAKLTKERRGHLIRRLRDHPPNEWFAAFDAIKRSKFLQGENPRGWRANFDFLLQPSSFVKLIEGQYDNQPVH